MSIQYPTGNAFAGVVGPLKLHTPPSICPFRRSVENCLTNYSELDRAFQQVTGWTLALRETDSSYRTRITAGDPDFPASSQLAIDDMSDMLPPGIPATSRIYCERLVNEINQLISERDSFLIESHKRKIQDQTARQDTVFPVRKANPDGKFQLPGSFPFQTSNIALTPLSVDENIASCDWFIESTGIARFATIICFNRQPLRTSELISARSTFLSECRHGANNMDLHEAIKDMISRIFPGGSFVYSVTGSLNPLTGDLAFVGAEQFLVNSTTANTVVAHAGAGQETRMHLPRGQHMIISRWPDGLEKDDLQSWMGTTVKHIRNIEPYQLSPVFQRRLIESIPSPPAPPQVALAISRL